MEIALLFSALFLGFASGFHCIGMCGPIALSMGLTREQKINFYLQNLTYNFGRIITYSILGAIIGIVGESFQFAGLQTTLSIVVGILLILMALFSFGGKDFATKIPFINKALLKVKLKLSKLLTKADLSSRFTTGLLNGLLPCGMVYMALTASIAAGGIWQSALYMLFFGLGTFPFMFAIVLIGNFLNQNMRLKIVKIVPIVMILLGGLFILRGLELGIPYLSPKKEALQIKHHNHGADPNDHTMCH
ncbi:sulfite exporter TauE/SafE family protein [Soonwooa sp.]|uniref:sulfite exporter TauE/SafE family protein n=1 Tax=Soonwooa sp. TaxID=1938592 RepID=UPI0028AFCD04|nr:sulfite exporter TauE/SafE family protein [Soonwooa sp.]